MSVVVRRRETVDHVSQQRRISPGGPGADSRPGAERSKPLPSWHWHEPHPTAKFFVLVMSVVVRRRETVDQVSQQRRISPGGPGADSCPRGERSKPLPSWHRHEPHPTAKFFVLVMSVVVRRRETADQVSQQRRISPGGPGVLAFTRRSRKKGVSMPNCIRTKRRTTVVTLPSSFDRFYVMRYAQHQRKRYSAASTRCA